MRRSLTRLPLFGFIVVCFFYLAAVHLTHAQDTMVLPPGQVGQAHSAQGNTEGGMAPHLLIIPHAVPPKILPPAKLAGTESDLHLSSASQGPVAKQTSYTPDRAPHWVVPLQSTATPATPQPSSTNDVQEKPPGHTRTPKDTLDPSKFIEVDEDTKTGNRWTLYKPGGKGAEKKALQLTADLESSILIVPDASLMGENPALNKLYVTAKLASGDSSKDVVVTGYSEVGKDKASMPAQSGTAFQSAANVEAMILNMAYTVGDIIRYAYSTPAQNTPDAEKASGQQTQTLDIQTWLSENREVDFKAKGILDTDALIATAIQTKQYDAGALQRVRERFRLYQPEVQAISDFFVRNENLKIVEEVGIEVFWIDRDSMQRIAQQYKDNIRIAFDSNSTAEAQAKALQDLLERTKLVYKDFGDFRRDIKDQMLEDVTSRNKKEPSWDGKYSREEWAEKYQNAILTYAGKKQKDAFNELKKFLATGNISLTDNKAKDGDRLTVTVESLPADSTTGGIPVVFEIAIKKYGAKIQWSPSLLFIRRLAVTDAEASPPVGSSTAPLNRINFAPSPGMTLALLISSAANAAATNSCARWDPA